MEVVRAELTQLLAKMKESENKLQAAHDLLQEEAVETFSGMVIRQKLAYLLGTCRLWLDCCWLVGIMGLYFGVNWVNGVEQLRLCLAVSDYIRANMIANKVDRVKLEAHEDLKVRFYRHLIEYYRHER